MRSVGGTAKVAALCFGFVAACIVGPSCAAKRPPSAGPDPWTLCDDTGTIEYGGRCPRCNEWVKGAGAGWAHGADAAGRPWNWHGYQAKCASCGANLFAELGHVEVEGRFRIIHWRLGEDDPIIAAAPAADTTP